MKGRLRATRPRRKRGLARRRVRTVLLSLVLLLLSTLSISVLAQGPIPRQPTNTYGAPEAMAGAQADREARLGTPQLQLETAGRLDDFPLRPAEALPTDIGQRIVPYPEPDLSFPPTIAAMNESVLANRSTILQFLIDQPLNYYIRTDYVGTVRWTEGLLRPGIDLQVVPDPNGGPPRLEVVNWDRWEYIDADNDTSTGDLGKELRVRLNVEVNDIQRITKPGFFGVFQRNDGLLLDLSIVVEVERVAIAPGTPIDVDLYKAFSYDGFDFLWMYGFSFIDLPVTFRSEIEASKVALDTSPDILDILFGGTGGLPQNLSIDGILGRFLSLNGPYYLRWLVGSDTGPISMTLGFARIQNQGLLERSWGEVAVAPPASGARIPHTIEVELRSPSFDQPFDNLRWSSEVPAHVLIRYFEEQVNFTYAELELADVPRTFSIALDDVLINGTNLTRMQFNASAPIARLSFALWLYYDRDPSSPFVMQAQLLGLPTKLVVVGDFDIGATSGTIQPPSIGRTGFVGAFLDNMLSRVAAKFARVGLTIRSLPAALVSTATNEGQIQLSLPINGERIGALSFSVTSSSMIEAEGSYLAFYNDTANLSPNATKPLQQTALSVRIEDIGELTLDFVDGTRLDAQIAPGEDLRVLMIDEPGDAHALLTVQQLPEHFSLDIGDDGIIVDTDVPASSLRYVSVVGAQRIQIALEDLPTHTEVGQSGEVVRLLAGPGQQIGAFSVLVTDGEPQQMEGDYLVMKRASGSYLLTGRLEHIQALRYLGGAGGYLHISQSEEAPFYVGLTDTDSAIDARFLVDPLPKEFELGLSGRLQSSGLGLSDVLGVSSIFDLLPLVHDIDALGLRLVDVASQLTSNVAVQVGEIGGGSSFDMTSSEPTTLIADVALGADAPTIPWPHGVYIQHEGPDAVSAKLYLRLPARVHYQTNSSVDSTIMDVRFDDFAPLHEWITLDILGTQSKDVQVYLDGLPASLPSIALQVNLSANLTPGTGRVDGSFSMRTETTLGQLLVAIRQHSDIDSLSSYYLSSVAKQIDLTVRLGTGVLLELRQSAATDLIVAKTVRISRYGIGSTYAIAHDVATETRVQVDPTTSVDIDGSLLQGLPQAVIESSGHTMDLYVHIDGAATGSQGQMVLHLRDIPDGTTATFDRDRGTYEIHAPGGIGMLYVRSSDQPYNRNVQLRSVLLVGTGVDHAVLTAHMVYGGYPMLEFSQVRADHLQLHFDIVGGPSRGGRPQPVVLLDLAMTGGIPTVARLSTNGLTHEPTDGDYHYVLPLPVTSLLLGALGR